MKISIILAAIILALAGALMSMTGLVNLKPAVAGGSRSFWVGVERAGINSHQPGRAWCPNGTFLVAFDQDGPRNYSPYDSPVVGQAMCGTARTPNNRWGSLKWVGVERAGINSHQPGRAWCPGGTFLVAFDLDGPRNYSSRDSPVVGQAMCASLAGRRQGAWGSCFWVGVDRARINSHQPGRQWCPDGTFLVAFDLDSKSNYAPHDSPVVGQAMCCSPP